MLGDKIKVQSKVVSDYTDEQLLFIKQMADALLNCPATALIWG